MRCARGERAINLVGAGASNGTRMLPLGTFETSRDVRSLAAIRRKTDVARTSPFCSEWPSSDSSEAFPYPI